VEVGKEGRKIWFLISTEVHDLRGWLCPGRGGQHVHGVHVPARRLRHRRRHLLRGDNSTDVRGVRCWLCPERGGQHVHGVHGARQLCHPRCRLLWFLISTDVRGVRCWLHPGRSGQHVYGGQPVYGGQHVRPPTPDSWGGQILRQFCLRVCPWERNRGSLGGLPGLPERYLRHVYSGEQPRRERDRHGRDEGAVACGWAPDGDRDTSEHQRGRLVCRAGLRTTQRRRVFWQGGNPMQLHSECELTARHRKCELGRGGCQHMQRTFTDEV